MKGKTALLSRISHFGQWLRDDTTAGFARVFPWRTAIAFSMLLFIFRLSLFLLASHSPLWEVCRYDKGQYYRSDELPYFAIAQTLSESNFTSFQVSHYDQSRPPVVPILAAILLKASGMTVVFSASWAVLQLFTASAAFCLALWTAWRIGLRPILWLAAMMCCFDLVSFSNCARLLSDATYVGIFTLAFALLPLGLTERTRLWRAMVTGMAFGLATLTRPIGLLFAIPMFLILWWKSDGKAMRRLLPAIAALLAFAVVTGVWVMRNAVVHGRPFISEIVKVNLYRCWAAQAEANRDSRTFAEVQQEYDLKMLHSLGDSYHEARARQDYVLSNALPLLLEHPTVYLRCAPAAAYSIFLPGATYSLSQLFGMERLKFADYLRAGRPLWFVLLLVAEKISLLLVYLFCGTVIIKALCRRKWLLPAFLILIPVLYHLGLSLMPTVTSRFRIPMMLWLIVLAASLPKLFYADSE
jgi:4-amino-4-deoxy-L-arabinose transferase-like glycosyltransferase